MGLSARKRTQGTRPCPLRVSDGLYAVVIGIVKCKVSRLVVLTRRAISVPRTDSRPYEQLEQDPMGHELRCCASRYGEEQDTAVYRNVVYHGRRQPPGLAVATFAPGDGPEVAKVRLVTRKRPLVRDVVGTSPGAGVFYPELFQRIVDRVQR
jgi:hypothetical protein